MEVLTAQDIALLKSIVIPGVTVLFSSIISLGVFYLKSLAKQVERFADQQTELNIRMVKIETKIVTELEHLKETTIQHNNRISILERR